VLFHRVQHPPGAPRRGSPGSCEAGEGDRTLDIQLGRLTLYR
jgi:hypothetical protein